MGRKTHGMTGSRIYIIWNSMRCRCEREQTNGYERYGGRGITVCDEWKNFETFMNWAMASGYSEELTLDRIDNNKGYSPDNCRWATRDEQMSNMRNNRMIELNGERLTVSEWSRRTGISRTTIERRLAEGWSEADALHTPPSTRKKPLLATNIKTGEPVIYDSSIDATKDGFSRSAIWRCLKGEYSHHHGYRFEYLTV